MKILYVTTIGPTMVFFRSFIKELLKEGHSVDIATNEEEGRVPECYREWGCKIFPVSCSRSPLDLGNLSAIGQIRSLAQGYDIVHCHTPIAAAVTRIACAGLRKKGLKVIYTAHGFHFYKGSPKKNWALFYPIEKLCAKFTDVLITINQEDFELVQTKFPKTKSYLVPGVGIDVKKFAGTKIDRDKKRAELGLGTEDFMLLSVGELNENKNHKAVISAMALLNNPSLHYVIAGKGDKLSELRILAKALGLENNVHLLGYRTDAAELYKAADLYILPSYREGLNVSLMEAFSGGLAALASDIRGNRDLLDNNKELLFNPEDPSEIAAGILKMSDKVSRTTCAISNVNRALKYDQCRINRQMHKIYFEN